VEVPGEFHILFVCTGNVCRSPFAELLTRRLLDDLLPPPDATRITVGSAGCHALRGHGVDPHTGAELARWDVPGPIIATHTARQVETGMLVGADLVLTAERTHRAHVARMYPQGLRRTFCLTEFHRLLSVVDPHGPVPGMHTMVEAAAAARGVSPPVPTEADGIPDPYGRSAQFHRGCARMISALVTDILAGLLTCRRRVSPGCAPPGATRRGS
jgi:low molecular weight protein-tyrosine phosphatase